jgi:hypothetical protein
MNQEPNEQTKGKTGEQVKHSGQYAASGCCRAIKQLSHGDKFRPVRSTATRRGHGYRQAQQLV